MPHNNQFIGSKMACQDLPDGHSDEEAAATNETLAKFRANKLAIMSLKNKILSARLERLRLTRQVFEELDLKSYEAKLDMLVSKIKFSTREASLKRLEELERNVAAGANSDGYKMELLGERITAMKSQLSKYQSLDPNLLSDYKKVKDDLDCQQMLIKMCESPSATRT